MQRAGRGLTGAMTIKLRIARTLALLQVVLGLWFGLAGLAQGIENLHTRDTGAFFARAALFGLLALPALCFLFRHDWARVLTGVEQALLLLLSGWLLAKGVITNQVPEFLMIYPLPGYGGALLTLALLVLASAAGVLSTFSREAGRWCTRRQTTSASTSR